MPEASFEEKEFEGPLYNQLEHGHPLVWSPGQVLEGRIGFDRSLLVRNPAFWRWLGFTKPLRGIALSRYSWPSWWRPIPPDRSLPSFRQNLFLQAKRCHYYARPPRTTTGFLPKVTWGFRITPHQHRALRTLAEKAGRMALVAYAAPVFHTRKELFTHTQKRTIVQNSTFPSVERLNSHTAWYYQVPGAKGIANPDPERIEEPNLDDRIASFAHSQSGNVTDPGDNLGALDDALFTAFIQSLGRRTSVPPYFEQRLLIERFVQGAGLDRATFHYLLVLHTIETMGLSWWIIG